MRAWFKRYVVGWTVFERAAKPTDPERGPGSMKYASSSHVVASAPYSRQRAANAAPSESNRKIRSYENTRRGATTIDSLQPIPSAHDATEIEVHIGLRLQVLLR